MLKQTFKGIGLALLLFLVYVMIQLGYSTFTDFQPEAVIPLSPNQSASIEQVNDSILTFITWNLGYGGLGAESDFFYNEGRILTSGGKMVCAPQNIVEKNVQGALQTIKDQPADFYLLQEVDFDSKRSYSIDQFSKIESILPNYASVKAVNYNVAYVPTPILEPWNCYGHTLSGLSTFSKYQPKTSTRFQLPGEFSWPNKVYLLDRCASQHRYALKNGKELVVYNVHNSAYDKDGKIKKQQMNFLRKQWLAEYEKGNYLVIGGDWNQCPPHFQPNKFNPGTPKRSGNYNIDPDFLPADWLWIYDPTTPTIRNISAPFQEHKTRVSLIDYFLISPNIKALEVQGIDLKFAYSDHQPVKVKIALLD